MCTRTCNGACPDGAECVNDVPSYNETPLGDYCLRPCQMSPDCTPLGTVCDGLDDQGKARYCF